MRSMTSMPNCQLASRLSGSSVWRNRRDRFLARVFVPIKHRDSLGVTGDKIFYRLSARREKLFAHDEADVRKAQADRFRRYLYSWLPPLAFFASAGGVMGAAKILPRSQFAAASSGWPPSCSSGTSLSGSRPAFAQNIAHREIGGGAETGDAHGSAAQLLNRLDLRLDHNIEGRHVHHSRRPRRGLRRRKSASTTPLPPAVAI